jgi:hypothetical protein
MKPGEGRIIGYLQKVKFDSEGNFSSDKDTQKALSKLRTFQIDRIVEFSDHPLVLLRINGIQVKAILDFLTRS